MRDYLRLLPAPSPALVIDHDTTLSEHSGPAQLTLMFAGVPGPVEEPYEQTLLGSCATAAAETPDIERRVTTPELAEMFAEQDALFDGLGQPQLHDAVMTMYFDADGHPRARSMNMRLAT